MQQILPLALIALGSVAIVVLRDWRLLVGALALQWAGLVLLVQAIVPGTRLLWVEATTALVCVVLLGWTVFSLHNLRVGRLPGLDEAQRETLLLRQEQRAWLSRQANLADQALLLVTALAGGVAGFGLALLYNLGGSEEVSIAFYWTVLSAVLALVLHAARDLLKLGMGLLVLLNAVALIVETMSLEGLSDLTLGLMGACRIGLVALVAYVLVALKVGHLDADLDDMFDARSGFAPESMALALVDMPDQEYFAPDAVVDLENDGAQEMAADQEVGEEHQEEKNEGERTHPEVTAGG